MISPPIGSTPVASLPATVDRWYYLALGVAVTTAALVSFGPGLVHSAGRLGPVTPLVAVHGIVFLAWLLLFLAQAALIAARRTGIHRQLGFASVGVAVLMLVLGYATAIEAARRGFDLSGVLNVKADPLGFLVFPLGDLVSFATLLTLGFCYRHAPELHKRLMLLATLGGTTPAIVNHFVGYILPSQIILILPLIAAVFFAPAICDRVRLGQFHPVTLWGGGLLFAWANMRAIVIGPSLAWHRFAGWLVQ